MVLVDVWHNTAFMMLVILAGLQAIPQELYAAAKVDGASPWKSFWWITLPLLKFTMAVAVMIRMIDLLRQGQDALDSAAKEWDKVTERRGRDKQRAAWGEKLEEMKTLGIEYHPDWAAKAK